MVKLGVNIDHVATLREVRKATEPDILLAAKEAIKGGADSITVHLREDERHIKYYDVLRLKSELNFPLNLEMSIDPEVVKRALTIIPYQATIVPERRMEITTERGLDLLSNFQRIKDVVSSLKDKGIIVSLFIDPEEDILKKVKSTGADRVELHTGAYALSFKKENFEKEKKRLFIAEHICKEEGLILHAGHGLNYENIYPLLELKSLAEVNIGHSIVSKAIFVGLRQAVTEMKKILS